jgi:hypothetical protein
MKKHKITMMVIFTVLFSCLFLMGCPPDDNNPVTGNTPYARHKVIILQAYGSSNGAAGASHSFVELYNITDEDISLDGIGLYYADGTTVGSGQINEATEDGAWKRISLDGKTIPAKGSFLILGPKESTAARYQIEDNYGDINDDNFTLSNRAFKVALIQSTANLTVQNPFNGNDGKPVAGYIDMVGAANDYQGRDLIFGFETSPARNSASEAVRRLDLTDRDNNRGKSATFPDADGDFTSIRYSLPSDNGITNEELEVLKPRNSSVGEWDPFEEPGEPLPPENPTVAGTPSALAGQLLILQVYGTGTATDGAVSHSFIELYNNTESPINLNTYSLQYANTTGTDWTVINLTGTIPAKGSYLVRGSNNNTSGRLQLDTADQDVAFYLDNGNFKVALMANQNKLTVENPFAMTGGKAKDYVDMVGVKNGNNDNIDGYETALAQVISKQAAARRGSLTDSDNNSADFVRIDYRVQSGNNGITNEQAAQYKPRTSVDGTWEPFPEEEGPGEVEDPVTAGTADSLAGQLLILQAYGSSSDAAGVSHSFVELYNNTDAAIDLNGIGLYYADGTSVANTQAPNTATKDGNWKRISLDGKSIPAKASFLILSSQQSPTDARYQIPVNSGDINDDSFTLSNRAFKVALIRNTKTLTAQNPFDMGSGAKAEGYIDMVGAANDYENRDLIFGFEGLPARNSASEAVRRVNLTDTDVNRGASSTFPTATGDFTSIRYATGSGSISNELLEVRKPRNSTETASGWDPFAEPEEPVVTEGSPKLMILQANTYGNNTGGFSKSLVELYNNTDAEITLTNYYLHIGDASSWTAVIDLSEALSASIPAKSSFLVVSSTDTLMTTPRAPLPTADLEAAFTLGNNGFKVALMLNQSTTLSVANPFGEASLSADYVDMLGAGTGNNTPNASETQSASQSRPQGPRRTSLEDTDRNNLDFAQVDYRASSGPADNELYKYWPRNSSAGAWNPITGLPIVQPQF